MSVMLLDLLDRHDAAQASVARLPHFSHPSRADGCEDFVRPNWLPGFNVIISFLQGPVASTLLASSGRC
jgi:hypothetical protein